MLFNSSQFVLFFTAVVTLYFVFPHRFRWFLLLIASYFFYMCWEPGYVVLILISTLVGYFAGIMMGRTTQQTLRRGYLILSLFANLGLLWFFKYYNFFSGALRASLAQLGIESAFPVSHFLLPIGISFYTFQTLSYTIEVYRGNQQPEKHLGIFALYVAFFPQLVAGPIERAPHLLPQLVRKYRFDYDRVTNGLKLIVWGLFKKMVIADRLGALVDPVYNDPTAHNGPMLTMATVFFTFQIYCDFSGYSDIAIGSAQVFGIKLMDNFQRPYLSKSIAEFWRRWHISLSSWFRDYLYIPLGGNRVALPRWYFNIFVVFLLSALWHGANWTFLAWGLLHAFYLITSSILRPLRARAVTVLRLDRTPSLQRFLQVATTFALVCIAWVFFRADSLSDTAYILSHMFSGWHVLLDREVLHNLGPSLNMEQHIFKKEFLLSVVLIGFLECVQLMQCRGSLRERLALKPAWVRFGVYSLGLWAIFLFGVFRQKEFIYFTF